MIKSLQKKFIFTAMIAVSVLLLFLLGAINIANILLVSGDVQRNLSMIADREFGIYNIPVKPKQEPIFFQRPKEDAFISANFFIVTYDKNNKIINIDVSRIPSVDENEAQKFAQNIDDINGRVSKFRYEVRQNDYKKIIVFLDTSAEIISYLRVLLLSGALGLICWLLMLTLVIILSKKAICPIAESVVCQKFSLSDMALEVSDSFLESMALKNIAFETKIESDIILNANSENIRQLFSILLDNAVKYTDENGLISLSLTKSDKNIIIDLQNTCETLPYINPEKLFDRFYRADKARTQKTGGYGIGLSVAKAIVNAQNGKITVNYINNNKICFKIIF